MNATTAAAPTCTECEHEGEAVRASYRLELADGRTVLACDCHLDILTEDGVVAARATL